MFLIVPVSRGLIQIHTAADPRHASLAGVLPDAELSLVGGGLVPLRQPHIEPAQPVHIQTVFQPVLVGIQHGVISRRLHTLQDGIDDLRQRLLGQAFLARILHIQAYRVQRLFSLHQPEDVLRFAFRLFLLQGRGYLDNGVRIAQRFL